MCHDVEIGRMWLEYNIDKLSIAKMTFVTLRDFTMVGHGCHDVALKNM